MAIVNIDFNVANTISKEMSSLSDSISDANAIVNNIKSLLNGMPSGFKTNATGIVDTIDSSINKIKTLIDTIHTNFDNQITNYRNKENQEQPLGEVTLNANGLTNGQVLKTYFGYPSGTSEMVKVTKAEMEEYFNKNGILSNNGTYTFNSNGMTIKYNINGTITIGNEQASCAFYKTSRTTLGNIKNTTTIIGGTGEASYGERNKLNSKAGIYDDALVIDIYGYNQENENMSKSNNIIAAGTIVGDYLSNCSNPNSVYNTAMGFSQGAQAVSRAVANHDGLYQSYIPVNGNGYWQGKDDIIELSAKNYNSFKDPNLEILFVSANGNDEKWTTGSKEQIMKTIASGKPASSISFLTNDSTILKWNDELGINTIKFENGAINSHSSGHELMSRLLGYTTSK